MNDSRDRDLMLFTEALKLSGAECTAFLDRACEGDVELRRRIEDLLAAHHRAGGFLEQPASALAGRAKTRIEAGESPGDWVGRYKLLQQIGEGGCGVVYMAEQEAPLRRRVALKIIKPGMDTKSVIARFEAERQALALMDHPSIAKVFDAGATESGRPYFVMELIRGVKITDYCDQKTLTTRERLGLFVQVCQAVQHAHQKGVIHRDIKPSNVLVTTTAEGFCLPVLIDFGIAKATTSQQLTDKTLFTAFEMLIGTPAYMSPEQADLASVDVDTRTDIYSLGVLLYELLTGSTPFDAAELMKEGLDEIRRIVREREPVPPSARLSKLTGPDLTSVARRRHSEPPAIIRAVRGDLDWIAMKALEKDRARRYETANGLALDVRRYLTNEPILAHPHGVLYKFKKTVLRNKPLFICIAVIASFLVAGLGVVSAALAKERRARREAEAQTAKSRQVEQFLKDMLNGAGPSVARGRDTTMLREILDRTAERLGNDLTNQPAVEADLRSLLGQVYLEMGIYDQAAKMTRAALAIHRRLSGPESPEAAASLNDLGVALWKDWKQPEAEAALREALAVRRRLFGNEHADVAASLNNLANVYRHYQRPAEAEQPAREALRIRRRLFGGDSLEAADSLRVISILLGDEGKWAESEAMAREVLAIRQKCLGLEDILVASSLHDVAWAASHQGKLEVVESLQRVALTMQRKLLGDEHLESLATMRDLGLTLEAEAKWPEAESLYRVALVAWRKRGDQESRQAFAMLESVIRVLMAEKKLREAESWADEALTPQLVAQPSSGDLLALRAGLKARRAQWQEAAADASLAFERQPLNIERYSMLAALLVKTGNRPAYEQLREKLLASFADTTNPLVADQVAKACLLLPASETDAQATARLADVAVKLGVGNARAMPYFQLCKSLSEYRQGHFAEAVLWAQKPLKIPGIYAHGHAYALLAMADWRLGVTNEARAMFAEGSALAPDSLPPSYATDPGNAWLAWLFARVSLDEAAALMKTSSIAGKYSNKP